MLSDRFFAAGRELRMGSFVMILVLVLVLGGCSGADEEKSEKQFDENGLFVSEAMNYDELKEYYSMDKAVSLNDAEGKLAQMNITGEEEATYRVVVQKVEGSEKYVPCIDFYLITSGDEEDWKIEKIQKAVLSVTADGKEAVFFGDITCWQRENNRIEYSLNGELSEPADTKEDAVVCREETEDGIIQLQYLPKTDDNLEDSEYINAHQFITL